MVQSFVVDFVEHVVPEPTGADFVNRLTSGTGDTPDLLVKGKKKKSLSYTKPQQNAKPNSCTLQEASLSCNHPDISRLFGWINSKSNQGKEAPTPSTSL